MRRCTTLARHPRTLYRMTGLTLDPFQTLTARLTPLWVEAERLRLSQRTRQHALGQGTQYKLPTMADTLLCVLAFDRFYLTDAFMGWLIGLDASTVCRLQQRLEPLLEQAADPSLGLSLRRRLPPEVKQIGTVEALLQVCPECAEVITDATEQPRQRPSRRSQRRWYSGRRKRHTIKTPITVNTTGRILLVSASVPGRVHDDALFTREGTAEQVPRAAPHDLDRGYDGAPTDYPEAHVIVPVKRWRILVEHVLSRMKKYQLLAQGSRHRIADDNHRFRNVAALVNFRLASTMA